MTCAVRLIGLRIKVQIEAENKDGSCVIMWVEFVPSSFVVVHLDPWTNAKKSGQGKPAQTQEAKENASVGF